MQKAIVILSGLFLLSYLGAAAYHWFALELWYAAEQHLQLVILSLGLAYFVRFVQSGTVLAIMFATILLPMVKLYFQWQNGDSSFQNMIGAYYLLFLLSYALVIYQIAKLKKQIRQQKNQKEED